MKSRLLTFISISIALPGLLLSLICHADPVPEYRMKAAFLYNFTLFTEWPKTADSSLSLCILGQSPVGEALDEIDGQEVNGRHLRVVHLSSAAAARSCQVLYLGELERTDVKKVLGELGDAPVLTISDAEDLAKSGVMIVMLLENRRLVFGVNVEAVKLAHLTLSSRLLRLARSVH